MRTRTQATSVIGGLDKVNSGAGCFVSYNTAHDPKDIKLFEYGKLTQDTGGNHNVGGLPGVISGQTATA